MLAWQKQLQDASQPALAQWQPLHHPPTGNIGSRQLPGLGSGAYSDAFRGQEGSEGSRPGGLGTRAQCVVSILSPVLPARHFPLTR